MKKTVIRYICFCIALLQTVLLLCGCTGFSLEANDLLKAPKMTGDMQPVQEALEKAIGGKYSYTFPRMGEYRSAVTMKDIDNDGKEEAVAFYSVTADNVVNMNIAVVDSTDGKWEVKAFDSLVANDVEKVSFSDLNGDGRLEILVGWNIYSNREKKVNVYEYTGDSLITILSEAQSVFVACDLNDDFLNDVLVVNINSALGVSEAKCFSASKEGINEIGNVQLDPGVTGYYEPIVAKLESGKFCVYLDGVKGAGLITEIIYFENSVLVNPLYNPESSEGAVTERASVIPCADFDGDGNAEVPVMTPFPVESQFTLNQQAYLTVWCVYTGSEFVPKIYSLLNYNDGYYIELNKELSEKITAVKNIQKRERKIYAYDYENDKFLDELFVIKAVPAASYDSKNLEIYGFEKIAESENLVYLVKTTEAAAGYGFDKEFIKKAFVIIKEG